jgi:hypothetical protein
MSDLRDAYITGWRAALVEAERRMTTDLHLPTANSDYFIVWLMIEEARSDAEKSFDAIQESR